MDFILFSILVFYVHCCCVDFFSFSFYEKIIEAPDGATLKATLKHEKQKELKEQIDPFLLSRSIDYGLIVDALAMWIQHSGFER